MRKIVLSLVLCLGMTHNAHSFDMSRKFGFGLTGGYSIPVFGNPFNSVADADFGYDLHGRYHFNESYLLDLDVSRLEFADTKIRLDNLNLLGAWRVFKEARVTPVLGMGIGLTRVKNFGPKSLKLSGLLRAGVESSITEWFSVGVLVDYQYVSKLLGDMPTTRAHMVIPQLALTWYFGGENKKIEVTEAIAEITKTSKKISNESNSNIVDESKLDSDDDGVNDPNDRCPLTAKGTLVNEIGCALDEQALVPVNIEFESGKTTIDKKFDEPLNEMASYLKKYSQIKVEIQGHTDNVGNSNRNLKLSTLRAQAVMNALLVRGIEKNRLSAKGYGSTVPLVDNSTEEGRRTNRRVVAALSSMKNN